MKIVPIRVAVCMLPLLVFVASCGGSNPTQPLSNFQPEIVNTADNFQFQATALTQVGATVSTPWQNSGTQATIDHSSAITAGTTLLQIFDADGTEVYSDSLQASASGLTAVGTTGSWQVVVTLTDVDGTLNFRVQTQ